MTERRAFNPGDRCMHKQMGRDFAGTVVRYFKPTRWKEGMVFWKGHNPFNPERVDWTWDFAMVNLENQKEETPS